MRQQTIFGKIHVRTVDFVRSMRIQTLEQRVDKRIDPQPAIGLQLA